MAKKIITKRRYRYQYAAKFICTANIPGTSQTTKSFPPGNYQTVVNIHNPSTKKIKFQMKLADPGVISKWRSQGLVGDGVTRVTCSDISKFGVITIHGFEGFLVIESNESLDVSAVYTAAGKNGYVVSIDMEQINERVIGK